MWFALASVVLGPIGLSPVQEAEAPTFLVETVGARDDAPLADCEVLVLETPEEMGGEDLAVLFLHGLQLAKRLESEGTRYRTDERGRLEMPFPARDFMIGATHDSGVVAYRGWVDPQFEGHLRLRLHEPRIAEVRCVGAEDEPLAGVPIVLSPVGLPLPLSRRLTDENGWARFSHLELYETAAEQGFFANLELVVAAPMQSPPRVAVSDALTTEEPVSFQFKELGVVEVEIPAGWRPTGSQVAALSLQPTAAPEVSSILPIPTDTGEAVLLRFPHVGLGLTLAAAIVDGERQAEPHEFAGPSEPGEVVRIALDLPAPQPGWAIRAVDGEGQLVANALFEGYFQSYRGGGGGNRSVVFRSDADGLIELPVLEEQPEDGTHRLYLRMDHEQASQRLEMRVEAKELAGSSTDSPKEVVFLAPHVVAAGQVVDAAGNPVEGATVSATRPRGPMWFMDMPGEARVNAQEATTDANGRFEVWSADERTPLSVFARRGGYDDGELEGVENGARDLRVVMQRSGEVIGRILLDEHVSPYGLSVGLSSEEYGNDWDQPDEHGRFRFGAVRNGVYTVRVSAMNGYHKFHSTRIELRGGQVVDDSGIREIDLRGKVFPIHIRVELLDGRECEGFTIRPKGGAFNPRAEGLGDSWTLLEDEVPVDLEIYKAGYRTATFDAVEDELFVELVPGPPVEITVDHPEWIPPGWSLEAFLTPPGDRGLFGRELDVDGTTTFSLSDPGRYAIRLTLSGPSGWSRGSVCETTFATVEEGTTVVALELDENAVKKAVEQ